MAAIQIHPDDHHETRERAARPITSWPLAVLARLDREGARGLLGDLTTSGVLRRQASFVVASADLTDPRIWLTQLNIDENGAEGIGIALRTRSAREIIAAVFGLSAHELPTGYLRALSRIHEVGSKQPGYDAFEDPASYRHLSEILVRDSQGRKAHALRYATTMRSSVIRAACTLDPTILAPETLGACGTAQRVAAANALMALIRATHTRVQEKDLADAIRQSLRDQGSLDVFARKAVTKADRLPAPFPDTDDLRFARSAAELRDLGSRLKNCAYTKLNEIALGLVAICEVIHHDAEGVATHAAATLTPIVDGRWLVSDVTGVANEAVPRPVLRAILRRLQSLGVIVPGPSPSSPYRHALAQMMGVYRWGHHDPVFRVNAQDDADDEDEAVMQDLLRGLEEAA